tara:strand:- start:1798 stop:1980 length:183 start_codon:yes stop_codon:yes gene_type:complete
MGRVTEFIHFINIDKKKLKLGQNLKGDTYSHITIKMWTKRKRYEYQTMLKSIKKEKQNGK